MQDLTPPEMSAFRYRVMTRVAHFVYFFIKGMTVGVRAACFDKDGRIFLVRHSYIPGWHMPGGGVERYETVREALAKELREEGNLQLTAPATLAAKVLRSSPVTGAAQRLKGRTVEAGAVAMAATSAA